MEGTSTEEILEEFALRCDFSIIIKDKSSKEILARLIKNINARQLSLNELFDLLIKENNLHHSFDGKVLRISRLKTQSFNLSYISSIREGQAITRAFVDARTRQGDFSLDEDNEDNVIKSFERFDFWENIEQELLSLLKDTDDTNTVIINPNAGLITINGTLNQLELAKNYIQDLQNRLKKQVAIDVSIIAVSLNKNHSQGINWQNFNLNFNSQNSNNANSLISFQGSNEGNAFVRNLGFNANFNLSSVLNFLSTNGKTRVLSSPKLVALNNQQAIISVGDTINYQVKESSKSTDSGTTVSESFNNYSIFIGILLNILPEISDDDKIMLRISPSLSNFKYVQDNLRQTRSIAPDTISKKLSTVVSMQDNQTLILGGLISLEESLDANSLNFLSKLPLLGALFSSKNEAKSSTEIVFIITPQIISPSYNPSLTDLGFTSI